MWHGVYGGSIAYGTAGGSSLYGKETSAEVEEEEHRFLEGICLPCYCVIEVDLLEHGSEVQVKSVPLCACSGGIWVGGKLVYEGTGPRRGSRIPQACSAGGASASIRTSPSP